VYCFVGRQYVWQLTRAIVGIKCDVAGNMHVHIWKRGNVNLDVRVFVGVG
jgi:hypothetical protein